MKNTTIINTVKKLMTTELISDVRGMSIYIKKRQKELRIFGIVYSTNSTKPTRYNGNKEVLEQIRLANTFRLTLEPTLLNEKIEILEKLLNDELLNLDFEINHYPDNTNNITIDNRDGDFEENLDDDEVIFLEDEEDKEDTIEKIKELENWLTA